MNDIDKLPSKCRDCPYWERAAEPDVCSDCTTPVKKCGGDYILRSDALEIATEWCPDDDGSVGKVGDLREMLDELESIPAADVELVRHGRWIPGKVVYSKYDEGRLVASYYDQWMCSVCNYVINDRLYSRISYKRCPECGAKMDAEQMKGG